MVIHSKLLKLVNLLWGTTKCKRFNCRLFRLCGTRVACTSASVLSAVCVQAIAAIVYSFNGYRRIGSCYSYFDSSRSQCFCPWWAVSLNKSNMTITAYIPDTFWSFAGCNMACFAQPSFDTKKYVWNLN